MSALVEYRQVCVDCSASGSTLSQRGGYGQDIQELSALAHSRQWPNHRVEVWLDGAIWARFSNGEQRNP